MDGHAFQQPGASVAAWSDAERLGEAMRRALPRLGPEARRQIEGILTPEALAVVAAILVVWIGSHFIGIGFVADAVLLVTGIVAIGAAVFEGLDHLYHFARLSLGAKGTAQLDRAANHFAQAVAILGAEAVLAVLFRGSPKTFKGGPQPVGSPPAHAGGFRYKPELRGSRNPADFGAPPYTPPQALVGQGVTLPYGEVIIFRPDLRHLSKREAEAARLETRMAAYHEAVHRRLTPKLNFLWRVRVEGRSKSYFRSSFSQYLEEAVAETVAQVGVQGFKAAFRGVTFPVRNGYVTLIRRNQTGLRGTLIEVGGILAGGFLIGDMAFDILWTHAPFHPAEAEQ